MYYVYILQSLKNNKFYIGYTADVIKRLRSHNEGLNKATKPNRPYKLLFYEAFINRKDAKAREIYMKSGWGHRSIKNLLRNYLR